MNAERWFGLLFLMWLTWFLALLFVPGLNPHRDLRPRVSFKSAGTRAGSTPAPVTIGSSPAAPR